MPIPTRGMLCLLFALLMAACAPEMLPPEDPVQQEPASAAEETPQASEQIAPGATDMPANPTQPVVPATEPPGGGFPPAVEAAIRSLSQLLGVQPTQIEVVSAESTIWRDSCLGLAAAGEMCLQVITPGYRVVLQVGEKLYTIHTDESGKNLRHAPGAALETPKTDLTQARVIIAAVRALREAHDLGNDQIEVVSMEPVDWPDACLGFSAPGEVCAQVISPGYRIILSSAGKEYEVHTDTIGESVRLAPPNP